MISDQRLPALRALRLISSVMAQPQAGFIAGVRARRPQTKSAEMSPTKAPHQTQATSPSIAPSDLTGSLLQEIRHMRTTMSQILNRLEGKTKPLYSVEEVAELTARSPYTIRRWVKEGRISATRVTGTGPRGRLLIARKELEKLV